MLHANGLGAPLTAPEPERSVPSSWYAAKRTLDLAIGSVALVFSLPVVAIAAIAVVAVDRGNPFFAQERVGKGGRPFRMFKLRTMVRGAHDMRAQLQHMNEVSGPVFKIRNDPRLHAIGGLLRRTSIDELPNLLNVLRGEMSLVGPRPPLAAEVAHYDGYAMQRLRVKPGITCLWQISGRSNVSFDDWMRMDHQYIETWTPLTDVKILLATVPAVLRKEGAH
ncbi:MAG: sugar transferase [Candidatus Baltobacteraceae bacterium]